MLVEKQTFFRYLDHLSEKCDGFCTTRTESSKDFLFEKWDIKRGNAVIGGYRPVDPIKNFLFPVRNDVMAASLPGERILIGVKNCDLKALELLDKALMEGEYVDPVYGDLREKTLIVAADCTEASDSCHCVLQGLKPFPESGFDVSISVLADSFLLQAGTDKGTEFMKLLSKTVKTFADLPDHRKAISMKREELAEKLERINSQWSESSTLKRVKLDLSNQTLFEPCIECGGCNFICPTCYCFSMNGEIVRNGFLKVRSWDGCQLKGYARVAGGANARPRLYERFNHRYGCKFTYMFEQFETSGCTGCGRCIDVCPAGIDIRNVMRKLKGRSEEPQG